MANYFTNSRRHFNHMTHISKQHLNNIKRTIFASEIDYKCVTTMRLEDQAHEYTYIKVHNPLHRKNEKALERHAQVLLIYIKRLIILNLLFHCFLCYLFHFCCHSFCHYVVNLHVNFNNF